MQLHVLCEKKLEAFPLLFYIYPSISGYSLYPPAHIQFSTIAHHCEPVSAVIVIHKPLSAPGTGPSWQPCSMHRLSSRHYVNWHVQCNSLIRLNEEKCYLLRAPRGRSRPDNLLFAVSQCKLSEGERHVCDFFPLSCYYEGYLLCRVQIWNLKVLQRLVLYGQDLSGLFGGILRCEYD